MVIKNSHLEIKTTAKNYNKNNFYNLSKIGIKLKKYISF